MSFAVNETDAQTLLVKCKDFAGHLTDTALQLQVQQPPVAPTRSILSRRYVVGAAGRLATALRPLVPDRVADKLAERTAKP